jgi:ATP-dependent Clp protease ATP-binding subunit ClpC
MVERFTDRARNVMQLADAEARRLGHEYLGTEHVLVGLVQEGTGVAAYVLNELGVDTAKVRQEIAKIIVSPGEGSILPLDRVPQTPRAKRVVEFAIEEARALKHDYVGTEHLLLGLLREDEGVGAQVLMNLGLDPAIVWKAVREKLGVGEQALQGPTRPHALLFLASKLLARLLDAFQEMKYDAVAAGDDQRAAALAEGIQKLGEVKESLLRQQRDAPS